MCSSPDVRAYLKSCQTVAAHVMRVHRSAFSPSIHLRFVSFFQLYPLLDEKRAWMYKPLDSQLRELLEGQVSELRRWC
jgi:hypothetical protein